MEYGKKLSALRENKGYTLEAVASYLNIETKELSSYEAGEKAPSLSISAKLADFYAIDIDALTDDRQEIVVHPAEEKEKKVRSTYWTFHSLIIKKKVIPIIIFSIFGLPLLIVGMVFFFPNFQNSSMQLLSTVSMIIGVLGFLMLGSIPILICAKIREYEYEGHKVIVYSSAYALYFIVDGYVREHLGGITRGKRDDGKDKYPPLKAKINGKTIILKIDDSRGFVLETEEGYPLKSFRQTGYFKKERNR